MSVETETMKQPSATAVPGTAGLKLRINLRDRQMIRKRHRSSSPSNSSDSSSTNGSNRPARSHTVSATGSKTLQQVKRNRREHGHDANPDDITPPEEEAPPLPDVSPRKKSPAGQNHRLEVKKVRLGTNGTTKYRGITFDSEETTEDGVHKKILLVDMNSDVPENSTELENQVPDPSGSPPASPVNDDEKKKFDSKKTMTTVDSKVKFVTASAIKRLSRDDLERLIMEQMIMAIRDKGATGQLEKKLEEADVTVERYRRRTEVLQKQVNDLELVVKRFIQQTKTRNQNLAAPVKVTRSVGLQINMGSVPLTASVTATPVSVIRKPAVMTVSSEPAKAAAAAASAPVATLTIKPTAPAQPAPQVTVSPPAPSAPSVTAPSNGGGGQQMSSFARVPVPPSFTMQDPGIASYVPSQAVPRYRTLLPKKAEESAPPPKLATYVNISGVVNKAGAHTANSNANGVSISTANLLKNTNVNITPVQSQQRNRPATAPAQTVDSLTKSRPALTVTNANTNNTVPSGPISPPPLMPTVPMPRWSRGPGVGPVTRATTVNKVTLPNGLPNVIDLTSEDLEKEKEKTTIAHLTSPTLPARPSPSKIAPPAPAQSAQVRGVALKSTTLNGRVAQPAGKQAHAAQAAHVNTAKPVLTHPAPLPPLPQGPVNAAWKPMPPKPTLDIKRVANGIVLSWNMQVSSNHADIASYQLFAYQEGSDPPPANGTVWKRVGDVKALPLPMACTLTQFLEGHRYHFAVRAMDVHGRAGPYSEPGTIVLS